VINGLSVKSCEMSKGGVGCSGSWCVVGGGGVPRLIRLVEGAMMETPRGGLQNDTRFVNRS
jgi:hypothetical protein